MQEQSRQTLLPGLKLSYDRPHFARTLFCQSKREALEWKNEGSSTA